jgi:hypothetical protein
LSLPFGQGISLFIQDVFSPDNESDKSRIAVSQGRVIIEELDACEKRSDIGYEPLRVEKSKTFRPSFPTAEGKADAKKGTLYLKIVKRNIKKGKGKRCDVGVVNVTSAPL